MLFLYGVAVVKKCIFKVKIYQNGNLIDTKIISTIIKQCYFLVDDNSEYKNWPFIFNIPCNLFGCESKSFFNGRQDNVQVCECHSLKTFNIPYLKN